MATTINCRIRTGDGLRAFITKYKIDDRSLSSSLRLPEEKIARIRAGKVWKKRIPYKYHADLDRYVLVACKKANIAAASKSKDDPTPNAREAVTGAPRTSDLPSRDVEEISRSLAFLRPAGNLQLVTIYPSGHPILAATFRMPRDQAAATAWAAERNKRGMGVYFAANPVKEGVSRKIRKDDVSQVEVAHADIDPDLINGYAAGRQELLENTLPKLQADLCSAVIDSGNGLQAIWKYSQCPNIETAERINRGIIDKYSGDQGTYDISRILRLPGTLNHPNKKKLDKGYPAAPSLAKLLYTSDHRHSPKEISQRFPVNRSNPSNDSPSHATERIDEQALKHRISQLAERNRKFKDRFTGSTEGLRDSSRSGMDMSIGATLKAAGFTYTEVAHTLLHLFKHGKGGENTERDLQRIWARAATAAAGNEWPDLQRFNSWDNVPDNPYPVDALGAVLSATVKDFTTNEGIDPCLGAQAVLSATAAVLQPRFRVVTDRHTTPLSLFLIGLARSGDGKSLAEDLASRPLEEHQQEELRCYTADKADDPNSRPRSPIFILKSVTTAGLIRSLNERSPHVIVQHSDAMAFLGSHAFKEGRSHETVSTLCDLWSGKPISIAQGHMEEIVYASNRALSLSLALQPEFAIQFLLNRQFEAQGLIPRSLTTYPRPVLLEPSEEMPNRLPREGYYTRVKEILDLPVELNQLMGDISFKPLTMTRRAHCLVKELQQSSRKLAFKNVDNMAAHHKRTAEQVIRLSGILALMDGNDHVEPCHVEGAMELEAYYRREWAWMRAKLQANGDHASEALQLWNWMKTRKEAAGVERFLPGDINRSGPRMCRNQPQLTQALVNELIDRGYIRRDGSCVEMRPANLF